MGDALMPFYGEPRVEEGSLDEAVATMDEALARKPEHILHNHVGITVIYENTDQLGAYRDAKSTRGYRNKPMNRVGASVLA